VMLVSVVASLVIYFPVGLMGQQDNFFAAVLYNCIASILFSFLFVVVFLFYWEGRSQQSHPLQADNLQADNLQADNRLQSPQISVPQDRFPKYRFHGSNALTNAPQRLSLGWWRSPLF
ncbi:MAG TPA: hypothetical protein V6C88_15485, partial [Chroococcidiopsis sp.]